MGPQVISEDGAEPIGFAPTAGGHVVAGCEPLSPSRRVLGWSAIFLSLLALVCATGIAIHGGAAFLRGRDKRRALPCLLFSSATLTVAWVIEPAGACAMGHPLTGQAKLVSAAGRIAPRMLQRVQSARSTIARGISTVAATCGPRG